MSLVNSKNTNVKLTMFGSRAVKKKQTNEKKNP